MSLMYDIDFVRNIRRTKDALDPIRLDNIDLMEDWVAEEPEFALLIKQDVNWTNIQEPLSTMTLDDDDVVLDEDDNDSDNDVMLTNTCTHVFYGPNVDPYEGWEQMILYNLC